MKKLNNIENIRVFAELEFQGGMHHTQSLEIPS